MTASIVWFRRDLRLDNHPAWEAATDADEVHPLFVVDSSLWNLASPRRQCHLSAALTKLDNALRARGGRLRVESGRPEIVLAAISEEVGAARVHVSAEVSPYGTARDRRVARVVDLVEHEGHYIHPPGSILTTAGSPYRVFTPFYRNWIEKPVATLDGSTAPTTIADIGGIGVPETGPRTSHGNMLDPERLLDSFRSSMDDYERLRDFPGHDATSHISVALKYGTVAPNMVFEIARSNSPSPGRDQFIRQLAWRDFFGHVMAAWPETVNEPMQTGLARLEWSDDREGLERWMSGQTGYPFVDAGMRQLVTEGWLTNRMRMVVASFLVKDLLIDWRSGEKFMRWQLVDGDVAQNVGNWQWVAGTGADAAPFFRVMNPLTQGRRFDPKGEYIRRWVPELAGLRDELIHAPWELETQQLEEAGVVLGENYPEPIVDHALARQRALDAYQRAKS